MTKAEWVLKYLAARPNENVRDAVEAWWEMERPGRASPYKAPDKPSADDEPTACWIIGSGNVVTLESGIQVRLSRPAHGSLA